MRVCQTISRVVIPVLVALPAAGARAEVARDKQPAVKLVTRVYNVRDLIHIGTDYPYKSRVRPPGWDAKRPEPPRRSRGFFDEEERSERRVESPPPKAASQVALKTLMELIREAVPAERWATGAMCIRALGTLIVVRETEANQKKIDELLSSIRREVTATRTVAVRARWVRLDKKQLAGLSGGGAKPGGPIVLTEAALAKAGDVTLCRAMTTGFDGQLISAASGNGQNLVIGAEPLVAEAAVAVTPVVERMLWGVVLEVRAVLTGDSGQVTLTVRSMLSELKQTRILPLGPLASVPKQHQLALGSTDARGAGGERRKITVPGRSRQAVDALQLPDYLVHSLRATVRVPLDRPVLVGGMTAPAGAAAPASKPAPKTDTMIYLILEASASKGAKR